MKARRAATVFYQRVWSGVISCKYLLMCRDKWKNRFLQLFFHSCVVVLSDKGTNTIFSSTFPIPWWNLSSTSLWILPAAVSSRNLLLITWHTFPPGNAPLGQLQHPNEELVVFSSRWQSAASAPWPLSCPRLPVELSVKEILFVKSTL